MTPESFRQFADSLPEPMLLVSGVGVVLALNRACHERFGDKAVEWQASAFADVVTDPAGDVARYLRLCCRTRQVVLGAVTVRGQVDTRCRVEGSLLRPRTSEAEALLMLRLTAAHASSAHFAFLNVRIQDLGKELHRRRLAEEQVRRHAELLRTTLASIGDAVVTTGVDGHVTNMNAVAESLTGWSNREAVGRPLAAVFKIVNETTRQPVENPADRALRDGTVVGLANHTVLVAKDGREWPIDDNAAPILGAEGDILGCVLVFRDVSERRRSEHRLSEAFRFYRSSLDALTSHVAILDEHGVILEVNEAWRRFAALNGYVGSGCGVGVNYLEVCESSSGECADDGAVARGIRDVLADRVRVFEFEYPCHSPARQQWYLLRVTRFSSPGPVRIVVSHDDVTTRYEAQEQLRATNARLLGILRQSPAGIVLADASGNMTLVNERWCQMLGYREVDLLGKNVLDVTHADSATATIEALARLKAGGPDFQVEKTYCRRDGSRLRAQSNVAALRSQDGEFLGLIAVVLDLTERIRAEGELRRLAAELSEADRRKNEFLATLAHELRNPLAPIRNGLELIRLAGSDIAAVERARDLIDRQVRQMVRLVDDLLDMSRISTGKVRLWKEAVSIADVVDSAVETSAPLIEQLGHELTVSLPSRPLFVHADPTRLAQVFSNLLNNAAKYSEPGGRIRLDAGLHGSDVVVSVKDAGIGLSADQLPHIFEMFSQVNQSLEKSQGGLGIGLSLVKGLVELHGGSVEARSGGPGHGAEFVVRLPAAGEASRDRAWSENDVGTTALRILIVDDSRDNAESLAMMLELTGNKTLTAFDGEQAVAAAAAFEPDLILLDLGLPKLDGFEACRQIRQQQTGKRPMIVAQTGWGQDEDRQRTRAAGFDHHLTKPLDPAVLMRLLQSLP